MFIIQKSAKHTLLQIQGECTGHKQRWLLEVLSFLK